MADYSDRIKELEEEIKNTQYNKRTQHHIGLVKAKIAVLKDKEIARSSSGGKGQGYSVRKTGDATVILIGFPSAGKSTLLNGITNANSPVAAYEFTTLTCIPGIMEFKGAKIQVLDLPGIIEGAKEGRGRGRKIIGVARGADLVLMIIDAAKPKQIESISHELEGFGIRLNKKPPNVFVSKTEKNGIMIQSTVKLTQISREEIISVLNEYDIYNGDVVFRDDCGVDELIDVLVGNRVYIPTIYVINKIDLVDKKQLEKFPKESIFISANNEYNLGMLKEQIYEKLRLISVYTKRKGEELDEEPLVVRTGTNVSEVCGLLHRELRRNFRYALVWGKSAKHPGQKVGLNHVLQDGDVIQIIKR